MSNSQSQQEKFTPKPSIENTKEISLVTPAIYLPT